MNAMPLWSLFISLTVVGSLVYNAGAKLGSNHINTFSFGIILGIAGLVMVTINFLVARYFFKVNVTEGLDTQGVLFAVVAGIGAVVFDLCYFCAFRYGTPIQTQIFVSVAGTIVFAIFSMIVFKEPMPATKAVGIVLGVVSLFLILRSS